MQRHHVVARHGRACRMVSFCASWVFTINTRSLPVRIRGLRSGLPITHTVSSDGCWFCTMREQESNLSTRGLEPRLTAAETPCSKETSGGHVELVERAWRDHERPLFRIPFSNPSHEVPHVRLRLADLFWTLY